MNDTGYRSNQSRHRVMAMTASAAAAAACDAFNYHHSAEIR